MFEIKEEHLSFDWSDYDKYAELNAICVNLHEFKTHTRFCGAIPALLSRKPCPECGQQEVVGYRGMHSHIFVHPESK